MQNVSIKVIESKYVCSSAQYFLGLIFSKIAIDRKQVRIGLVWYHICVTWNFKG